ncbi:MAG: hypothetical protein A2542_03980 [Parcubacteria group bacterium RIFOXYD2_FULL_52_8]|nr:MAG: hypothetical protein A2542_03980 [Parcubacteria group bacterium RIFOXYD2_FULL_52_8]
MKTLVLTTPSFYRFTLLKIAIIALFVLPDFLREEYIVDFATKVAIADVTDTLLYKLTFVVLFGVVGYLEQQRVNFPLIWKTALAATLLSLFNPMFWGWGHGNPAFPNYIVLPFIFIGALVGGIFGGAAGIERTKLRDEERGQLPKP